MKKLITLFAVFTLLALPGMALDPVAQGETNCKLGAYIVVKSSAPLIVDARILPTYEVSYENSDMTIRIAVDNSDKKCRKYIVVCDNLTMQYNCDGKIFGASMLDDNYIEDGFSSNGAYLDRAEYFKQKVITQIEKSELEQIKLISVFFPKLVKDYNTVFAVK